MAPSQRTRSAPRRRGRAGFGILLAGAALLLAPAPAEARRGSRSEAIQVCAQEMSRRFGNAPIQVEEVRRVTRRGDRLSVEARMRVQRVGIRPIVREVDCAVDFSARRPRLLAFSVDRDATTGGGWGQGSGTDQRAARIWWREAEAVGYPVRAVLGVRPADRNGRAVVLRAGRNDEVHCLYRNGVRDLRYRRR